MMKYLLLFLILISAVFLPASFTSCHSCKNDKPEIRVVNNSAKTISATIQFSSDSLKINPIPPGTTTSLKVIEAGVISVILHIDSTQEVSTFITNTCSEYTATLDASEKIQISWVER
jgi:hypothetical protein